MSPTGQTNSSRLLEISCNIIDFLTELKKGEAGRENGSNESETI